MAIQVHNIAFRVGGTQTESQMDKQMGNEMETGVR